MLQIVTELADGGNLHERLRKLGGGKKLPEKLVWKYFIQTALGLDHIHSKSILHRDVKYKSPQSYIKFLDTDNCTKTLNPEPATLNPQPSTLNPQPSIRNPEPSTLNPGP